MSNETNIKNAELAMLNKMSKIYRGGAISTFNAIIQGSPVDTGRFRANWQADVNTPSSDVKFETVPQGQTISSVTDASKSLGSATLSDTLYLTNNLPYAQKLEEGSSSQRGAGWVAATLVAAKSKLQAKIDSIGDE